MYSNNSISTQEWMDKVASKGGTTEEAVKHFEKWCVSKNIQEAVEAARIRSQQVGS